MAKLEQQLIEAGKKLQHPPQSKDALLKILKQVANYLSEVDQSPSQMMLKAMRPSMNALVEPDLLGHWDKDIKLLVAACISEITRITAPDAPYSDDVLRDVFPLIVGSFQGLDELDNPFFGRRVTILETVAKIRSCVVMLDLECDDLIVEMFRIFFSIASEAHPENVLKAMQTIMTVILDESEDISEKLAIVLAYLGREKKDVSPAAHRLAMNIIEQCAIKLEPYVYDFIASAMSSEEKFETDIHTHYYDIIYDIYQCAPHMLQRIIPYMKQKLLTDQLDVRLNAVKLVGCLFAIPGHPLPEVFQPLFSEFLKRFTDKDVEVRLSVVEHAKECLLSNPFRHEAADIVFALSAQLLDSDESVRKQVVAAICDVANYALKSIPMETIRHVAGCLRDKVVSVRMYTLNRLSEIYRIYCLKCSDGSICDYEFEWIPQKIIRCCYDKDFGPQEIEFVLSESLFPSDLSVLERVKHWIITCSKFEKFEMKALEGVLAQKQRLQQDMQSYLLLRQKLKEDNSPELEKKIASCFKIMSLSFKDSAKAEENFQKLNQLKDNNFWKALTNLLDPSKTFSEAQAIYIDMLGGLGEKHPQYDFIKILGSKCSYRLFMKEHLREMLKEITINKVAGRDGLIKSIMNLLALFAGFFPSLVQGSEEDLLQLLKEDNECIKEGVVHILSKVGGSIGEPVTDKTSSVDLLLETLCLEGSRKQAKYAVQALATITEDAGLKSLSVLYKRLVDMLESGTHLPAILQSLGCIAQTAMPVFETREEDVIQFVCDKLLRMNNNPVDLSKTEWEDRSEVCLLKIYGIKALVKSYLPKKDAHLRQSIEPLLEILTKVLTYGEISEDVKSSEVDKAYLRLAAAKSLLRLSRHWDHRIPPELFYLTLRIAQDAYPEVRREFLGKVHQYLQDQTLSQKYACAFVLYLSGVNDDNIEEVRQYLIDFVETFHEDDQLWQYYGHSKGNLITACPEYCLAYLVHALAHNPEFPAVTGDLCAEAFELLYGQLRFFLSVFTHSDEGACSESVMKRQQESLTIFTTILESIKESEDAVDKSKSENLYALCDLSLSIIKELFQNVAPPLEYKVSVSLPCILYRPFEEGKGNDLKANMRDFTAGFAGSGIFGSGIFAHLQASSMHIVGHQIPDQRTDNCIEENANKESEKDNLEEPLRKMIRNPKLRENRKENNSRVRTSIKPAKFLKVCSNTDSKNVLKEAMVGVQKTSKSGESFKLSDHVSNGLEDTANRVREQVIVDDTGIFISSKKKRGWPGKEKDVTDSKPGQPKRGHKKGSGKRSLAKQETYFEGSIMERTEIESASVNEVEEKHVESPSTQQLELSEDSLLKASRLNTIKDNLTKSVQKSLAAIENDSRVDEKSDTRQLAKLHKKKKKSAFQPDSGAKDASDSLKSKGIYRKPLKKKSLSGLQKSMEKVKQRFDYEKLAGLRIKVWWPLDKQFYEGIVQSYDPIKKKHRILYDDGDVEVLRLQKERWELIDVEFLPEKLAPTSLDRTKSVDATPEKERSHMSNLGGKKKNSSHKRRTFLPKYTKKSTIQSYLKPDDNGLCPSSDSIGVKAVDTFIFMDDKERAVGGKKGKRKPGSGGRKGGHFGTSSRLTSGAARVSEEACIKDDDEQKIAPSDFGSRDSDDEPLSAWWSRMRKMR